MAKKITGKDLTKLITATVRKTLEEAKRLADEPPGKKPKDKKDKDSKKDKKPKKGFFESVASWIDGDDDEEEEDDDGEEEEGDDEDGDEEEDAEDDDEG